ncbi:hypothetical protein [Salinibacterium sp. ZJ70]|uniref:hypothetical protein n=1 Tax=Salinibacterium sp. ZJ70 TaxID=2708084 RepID=UPI00141F9788|nr:hypothetical protein [Salinibacterium sp. ZJ70]
MNEQSGSSPSSVVRGVRRAAIITIVASLAIAALLGIIALLSGDFGEVQARVLLTTLTVAAFGTTALCHLAVVARRVRVVGFIGIAASVVAALCAIVLIWSDLPWDQIEPLFKGLSVGGIAAASLAQANLLLLLSGRRQQVIRVALAVTLAAIGVVAIMIILPILTDGEFPGDAAGEAYWRFFGVIAILDALGTIALPILGLVLRGAAEPVTPPAAGALPLSDADPGSLTVVLPPDVAELVRASAEHYGRAPEEYAVGVLQAALTATAPVESGGTAEQA